MLALPNLDCKKIDRVRVLPEYFHQSLEGASGRQYQPALSILILINAQQVVNQ